MPSEMYRYKFPRLGKPPLFVMKIKEYNGEVEYYDPEKRELNRRFKQEFDRLFEPMKK